MDLFSPETRRLNTFTSHQKQKHSSVHQLDPPVFDLHLQQLQDEKEKILDALKDGQSWLDSNPEADAEEIKEKHKERRGIRGAGEPCRWEYHKHPQVLPFFPSLTGTWSYRTRLVQSFAAVCK